MNEQPVPVMVRCLGGFSVQIGHQTILRWRGGRARNLFQYLVVNRNKVVLKEKLYEAIWPGTERSSQSSSLKVAVHAIRGALNSDPGRRGDTPLEVSYQDGGYALWVRDGTWIDFDAFVDLAEQARAAESDGALDRAAELYEAATALYRGDFLAAENADWVEEQRQWLRGRVLRALRYLAWHALHRNDSTKAVGYCRRTLEIEPLHEGTYRTLMVVHARRGELSQVKRWHDLCTRRLREYLDAAPAEITDRLLLRAMRGEIATATATR